MKKIGIIVAILLYFTLMILYANVFRQKVTTDKPNDYMPNPRFYPERYKKDSPIHKAKVLHRTVRRCSDHSPVSEPQVIKIKRDDGTYYRNYVCSNRYEAQCIKDGSFDSYYDEWCEDEFGDKIDIK